MRAVKTEYIRVNTVFYVQNILHNIIWMYEDNDERWKKFHSQDRISFFYSEIILF